MLYRTAITAAIMAAIGLCAAPAVAGQQITFNLNNAYLQVTPGTDPDASNVTAYDDVGSGLQMFLEIPALTPKIRDSATLSYDEFAFSLSLDFARVAGEWTVTGDLSFTDIHGSSKVVGKFAADYLLYIEDPDPHAIHAIQVVGKIWTDSAKHDSMLVGTSDEWTFDGSGVLSGSLDMDGSMSETPPRPAITVEHDRDQWDTGVLTTMKFGGIEATTLDAFLATAGLYDGGHVQGTIIPAPAAFGLGLMGLTLVGYWMRRFA